MIESLQRVCPGARVSVLAFDELAAHALAALDLAGVAVICLEDFENDALRKARAERSRVEYLWTCTAPLLLHMLEKEGQKECTYLDADLYFYASPEILFEEAGAASVILTGHRYTPCYDRSVLFGRYCVQFMTFRDEPESLRALRWWRDRCLEWCGYQARDGRFGDQKYLDEFPARFEGVHELRHSGAGVAPWNVQQFALFEKDGALHGRVKKSGEEFPLVFYHFHGVNFYSDHWVDLCGYRLDRDTINLLYRPYIRILADYRDRLARHGVDAWGVVRRPLTWRTPHRAALVALRLFRGGFNVRRVGPLIRGD